MDLFDWLNTPAFELLGKPVPYSDLFGNICALATVVLALRRNILSWPVQILGSILLFSASLSAGLGGNASRQVVIIVAAVWGWTQWKKSKAAAGEVLVRWASWKERAILLAALAIGTGVFGWVLAAGGWSWNPYPDAYIFIGSIVAMYAQGRAIVEFWFVWLAVDLVGIPLADRRRTRLLRSRLPVLPRHGHPRTHRLVEALTPDDLGAPPSGHRHRPRPRGLNGGDRGCRC
jgi:nicotinamide mononucleotide transporter